MKSKIKTIAGIAVGISLMGWFLDLGEFNGDMKLAVFEVTMMSLVFFAVLSAAFIAWTAIRNFQK